MENQKLSKEKLLSAFLKAGLSTRQSDFLADHIRSSDVFEVTPEKGDIVKDVQEVIMNEEV